MKKFIIAAILSLSMLTACSDNVDHIVIKGKEYLTSLTELDLSGLNLTDEDIKDLDKMTNLTYLNLYSNRISDISPLKNLTNLTKLDLGYTQISDNDIEELKQVLPDCEIDYLGICL